MGITEDFQDKEIADRFWNAQTGGNRMRIRKFCGGFFSRLERAHNRRTTRGLHREHAWPLFPDPTEDFHFIESFPHSDETGATAGWINNHIGQLPITLLRQ